MPSTPIVISSICAAEGVGHRIQANVRKTAVAIDRLMVLPSLTIVTTLVLSTAIYPKHWRAVYIFQGAHMSSQREHIADARRRRFSNCGLPQVRGSMHVSYIHLRERKRAGTPGEESQKARLYLLAWPAGCGMHSRLNLRGNRGYQIARRHSERNNRREASESLSNLDHWAMRPGVTSSTRQYRTWHPHASETYAPASKTAFTSLVASAALTATTPASDADPGSQARSRTRWR